MSKSPSASIQKTSHPVVFLILFLPFGIISGYLTVTLAYLFAKAGVSMDKITILVALAYVPQMLKFLWAPLVDVTLSVKKWYVLSAVLSAACILGTSVIPIREASLPFLTFIILLSNFAISFLAAAANSLSAYDTPDEKKGRVSGYIQAGNMGGSAVGGGAGLWLAQHMPYIWMSGGALALSFLLCCLALYYVNEPDSNIKVEHAATSMSNLIKDVWNTISRKRGLLALILCLMPIGTAAASNLFSAMAKDWNTSADVVALVTGIVGGLVITAGSLLGGWICDVMDRKTAYLLIGISQAAAAVGMAYFPHTQNMYIVWTLVYSVTTGLAYAAFNAFTLEAIGKGAAATKFELYASISNLPISLMTFIAGAAYTKWGGKGMLNTEAVCAMLAIGLFALISGLIKGNNKVIEPVLSEG